MTQCRVYIKNTSLCEKKINHLIRSEHMCEIFKGKVKKNCFSLSAYWQTSDGFVLKWTGNCSYSLHLDKSPTIKGPQCYHHHVALWTWLRFCCCCFFHQTYLLDVWILPLFGIPIRPKHATLCHMV